MHVHWYDQAYLPLLTANAVTGVRQMAGAPVHLAWRKELAAGTLAGPRMLLAGDPLAHRSPRRSRLRLSAILSAPGIFEQISTLATDIIFAIKVSQSFIVPADDGVRAFHPLLDYIN
jgi:hypothetical protein